MHGDDCSDCVLIKFRPGTVDGTRGGRERERKKRRKKEEDENSFLACQEVTPVSDVLICEGASQSFVHCPQLPRYCAERIRLLCGTDTVVV